MKFGFMRRYFGNSTMTYGGQSGERNRPARHECPERYIAFVLVITVCVLPAIAQGAPDVVEPTEQFYVADYADVIDEATERIIFEESAKLCAETGAQVVVVTVDFIGESTIEEYARALFNKWGIGDKDKNNGVLLLMVIGEENYWCVQGSGLEEKLTTSAIKNILDLCLEPDFAKQDYSRGAYLFHNAVCVRLRQIDKKEREAEEQEQEAEEKEREAEERHKRYLEQLEKEEKARKRRRFWNNVWEDIKLVFAIIVLAFFAFIFIILFKPDSEAERKRKEQVAKEKEKREREILEIARKGRGRYSGHSSSSSSSSYSSSNYSSSSYWPSSSSSDDSSSSHSSSSSSSWGSSYTPPKPSYTQPPPPPSKPKNDYVYTPAAYSSGSSSSSGSSGSSYRSSSGSSSRSNPPASRSSNARSSTGSHSGGGGSTRGGGAGRG